MCDVTDVAVIMSVYKNDDVNAFEKAVHSIIKQTYDVDLYIYCDGELPPSLYKKVNLLAKHNQIDVLENKLNKGLAHALNQMIEVVLDKGYEFIARMDSDDLSRPNRIEKQMLFMTSNDHVDVCGTYCREFGASHALEIKSLPLKHDQLVDFAITRCPFVHPTVMFRRRVFLEGYRYPTNTRLTEDMGLWFNLLKGNKIFANLDEVLLDYRLTEDTLTRRHGLSKALSEFLMRFNHMIKLKRISLHNIILVSLRLVFHLLPTSLLKVLYRYFR